MEIKIRKAAPKDAEQFAGLFEAYREFYKRLPDPSGAVRYIQARLEKEEAVIFLAIGQAEEAVGFVLMYPTFDSLAMKPAWILYDLFVHPQVRRHGVGRKLMTRAAEHARTSGASYISLDTAVGNEPARALYESLGYRQEKEFLTYLLPIGEAV